MDEPVQPNLTNKPSPILIVFLLVPLIGILVALLMIANNPENNTGLPNMGVDAPSLINYEAPPFEVLDLNGQVFSLLDYRGRVVFLNFWQTTCIPCRTEMPDFAQFSAEQGADGVAVIALNFDENNDIVQTFLNDYNVVGLQVGMDYESRIQRAYGVANIPTTFIINEEGVVVNMKLGIMTLEEMYEYADSLKSNTQ
jgi:thiol-disulfide isomerase/thioredoxin